MPHDKDALQYILDAWANHFRMPTNKEMSEKFGGTKEWVNIRLDLMDPKKWLNSKGEPVDPEKGRLLKSDIYDFEPNPVLIEDFMKSQSQVKPPLPQLISDPDYFIPVEIPYRGTVKASKKGFEETTYDDSPDVEKALIPDVSPGQSLYVMEVLGESMVSDHILPHDLLVVEYIEEAQVKDNDLLVAYYLKEKFNAYDDEQLKAAKWTEDDFEGPTVKYVTRIQFSGRVHGRKVSRTYFRLSPKNEAEEYTIETTHFQEGKLGRAVAIHRTIRRI